MYKKTLVKIDKRMTKCIIAATLLILIVATTAVLSNAGVVLAQIASKPKIGYDERLTIENVARVDSCPYEAQYCPQFSNTGMTTHLKAPPLNEYNLPAGSWGEQKTYTLTIAHGTRYIIYTSVTKPEYTFVTRGTPPLTVDYKLMGVYILGTPNDVPGHCSGTDRCGGEML